VCSPVCDPPPQGKEYVLQIGNQQLFGKLVELTKPLAVLEKRALDGGPGGVSGGSDGAASADAAADGSDDADADMGAGGVSGRWTPPSQWGSLCFLV
jgi:hypothetical protein